MVLMVLMVLMLLRVLRVLMVLRVLIVRTQVVLLLLLLSELKRSGVGLVSLRVLTDGARLGLGLGLSLTGLTPQLFDLSPLYRTTVT